MKMTPDARQAGAARGALVNLVSVNASVSIRV
jgi:hypothetical protein